MKFEISNNRIIKDCLETICIIIDELVFEADSEGIRLRALDKSHITFIDLEWNNNLFEAYQCNEPTSFCVDASELLKIIKRSKPNDVLTVEGDERNLIIIYDGDSRRTFKLRLIDVEYETPVPPTVNYPVHLSIPTDVFNDALIDAELYGEKISLSVDNDYFITSADGEFGVNHNRYLHGESIGDYVKSTYAIPKIKEMLKGKSLSHEVKLGLGDNLPLTLEYHSPTNDYKLGFLLAPRIDSSEEDY
jgi:proliferating cell nuclear antigen